MFARRPAARRSARPAARRPRRSPAAWPSTSRTRSASARPHVDVVVGPDGYRRLPTTSTRPAPARAVARHPARSRRDLRGARPARGRRRRRRRARHHPARLRQVLHLLRGALHARPRARGAAARDPAPGARPGGRRLQGGAAPRPDRELVPLRGRRLRRAPARGRRRRRHRADPLHVALPARLLRRRHRRDRREPKVCKHVHLPLQSAARDAVLARMRRGYDFADFRALVGELRAAIPGIAITTDLLIGFCDETEAEFTRETLRAHGRAALRQRVHVRLLRARGDLRRPQDARHVPAEVKARRLAEIDRAPAADHRARSWPRRSGGASAS